MYIYTTNTQRIIQKIDTWRNPNQRGVEVHNKSKTNAISIEDDPSLLKEIGSNYCNYPFPILASK